MRVLLLILLCAASAVASPGQRVQSVFDAAARRFPGRPGMVFIELGPGQKASYNADGVFESASLVKVAILLEVYREAREGKLSLDQRLTMRGDHRAPGSGTLKDRPAGRSYPIRQLAELMVTISDNTATNMLVERVGMDAVNRRLAALGLVRTRLRRDIMDFAAIDRGLDNLTTPAETASLMKVIAQADPDVVEVLKGQKRRHMIPAGLPKGVPVASKTGELTGVVNDAAIVWTPKGAYVLALLSSDVADAEAARKAWRELSSAVHRAYVQ